MATRSQAFPSNYLGKDDVPQPITATIEKVSGEMVGQGAEAEEKRVAHFSNGTKPMILNSGNWQIIEAITGQTDDDNWTGTTIEIYIDPTVSFGGKRVGGLRVREVQNRPATKPTQAQQPPNQPPSNPARMNAWKRFCVLNSNETADVRNAAWKALLEAHFPGVTSENIKASQWAMLVSGGFKMPNTAEPFPDEAGAGIAPDDIPFNHGFNPVL